MLDTLGDDVRAHLSLAARRAGRAAAARQIRPAPSPDARPHRDLKEIDHVLNPTTSTAC